MDERMYLFCKPNGWMDIVRVPTKRPVCPNFGHVHNGNAYGLRSRIIALSMTTMAQWMSLSLSVIHRWWPLAQSVWLRRARLRWLFSFHASQGPNENAVKGSDCSADFYYPKRWLSFKSHNIKTLNPKHVKTGSNCRSNDHRNVGVSRFIVAHCTVLNP